MTTRSEQKRAAVLAAAQAEFQEKGFALSSMDAIAARAAVSKRTVYNHFPSKEALFDAIAGEFWQQSRALMAQTYQADVAIDVQLLSIARQVRSFYRNEQVIERARLLLAELIRQPELAQQIMQQMAEDCGLQLFLQQAVSAGALVIADVALAESQFWALCKAVDFWPLVLRLPCVDDLDESALYSNVQMFVRAYQAA
ncbi:MAG TPA: TetR/AcrR family transcriptional regulator [Rheinheimera sp.]|nr:TetR/AcrR family transcriptional regulator [Rheinheimera sp.]